MTRTVAALALFLAIPLSALAKPQVAITLAAKKEVTVTKEDGKKETRIVPADTITPGETIIYVLSFANKGDEAAKNVVLDNPIPEGTAYLPNTASEKGADVTFSIDGGKSYKKPTLLTYEVKRPDGKTEKRTASPEEYTHIRWTLPEIAAGGDGEVSYRVRVK